MNHYIDTAGAIHPVKNLSWLINQIGKQNIHAIYIDVYRVQDTLYMSVTLSDGRVFVSTWVSASVLDDWLHSRRNLRGVKLWWLGRITTV